MLRFVNLTRARSRASTVAWATSSHISEVDVADAVQRNAHSLRTPKHEGLNGGVWPHVWPIQIHAQRKPALMDSRPAGGGAWGALDPFTPLE
jgi:hypothetical protein